MNNNYTDRFKDAPWFKGSKEEIILVGGIGGIGSNAMYCLSKTIPAKYYIFDFDNVEEINVGTQFFKKNQVGLAKVSAVRQTISEFSDTYIQVFKNKVEKALPISISAFDNMEARRTLFKAWKSLENREIFIDGRLRASLYEVYTVTKENEDLYEATLFSDDEVADDPCTFKQTAYFAMLIGARITQVLVNYLTNKYSGEDICNIPFRIHEVGEPFLIKTDYNDISK